MAALRHSANKFLLPSLALSTNYYSFDTSTTLLTPPPFPRRRRQPHIVTFAKGFGADKDKPASKGGSGRDKRKAAIKSNKTPAASAPCPCFSGKPYGECCKPFHDGEKSPQPVEVMRARYAAYAW